MLYFFTSLKIIALNSINYLRGSLVYDDYVINILKELAELNITFAKIFQWSFINKRQKNYYITDKIYDFVKTYTTDSPYKTSDINYNKILQIYVKSKELGEQFELDSLVPINSGTISLIFKGKINNKPIAIKLLRNNIESELEKGLYFLGNIGYLLSFIPYVNILMIDKIIEENKQNFYDQKNFANEIDNIQLFYNKFKKSKICVCPNVYPQYTHKIKDIIIMDYIDGKKIYELTDDEKQKFVLPLIKFFKNSIFYKNILHCDLHSGNVLFITEKKNESITYKIGVIDMGMIINLSVHDCDFCYYYTNCIFNHEFIDMVEYMFNNEFCKKIFHKIDESKRLELRNYLIEQHNNNNLFKNNDVEYVINDTYVFLSLFKKYNFEFSKNIYTMILALLPIFSIIVGLGNDKRNNDIVKKEFIKIKNNDFFNDV